MRTTNNKQLLPVISAAITLYDMKMFVLNCHSYYGVSNILFMIDKGSQRIKAHEYMKN